MKNSDTNILKIKSITSIEMKIKMKEVVTVVVKIKNTNN